MENDFINKLTEIIEENISNEQFGVSELASRIGMSRSNLLRKVKKNTGLSVSVFIRHVRLKNAMDLLMQESYNVSEVSYRVGFNSTSYFIKCFHDHYGYPPGEAGKRELEKSDTPEKGHSGLKRKTILIGAALVLISVISLISIIGPGFSGGKAPEKSIAVLPFKNDSNDSSNVYLINGLMESILNDLQKIEDLRVISRTSVEKYRESDKTIPEIARELDVSYFVEGSGQKIGDQILLNIQLIEGKSDRHLWAEQYTREATDIFNLQKEIAKKIAGNVKAIITPEEEARIDKVPTQNLQAYDYFLMGLDLLNRETEEGALKSIGFFHKAIDHDHSFARAHAGIAIAYYLLDALRADKIYIDSIDFYADRALLLDPHLPQSMLAKSLFFLNIGAYDQALPYLEKALEYNPNSALVINALSDFYARYNPDTEKYLEYALKGISLDIASKDSAEASIIYLHVANAFIQSGFIAEAERYITRSLEYNPENLYSEQVRAYISFAENGDLNQTLEILLQAHKKDTTRLDIIQEVGKIYYYMRDYKKAYQFYKPFLDVRDALNLGIYRSENGKIGLVLSELGYREKSEILFEDYRNYAMNDQSIYKHLSLAMYYSVKGDRASSLDHLKLFLQEENYHFWTLLFLRIDPLIDNIKEDPEFLSIMDEIEGKFWAQHRNMKKTLEQKDLI